ncbi:DUF1800 domain-containing protein [Nocardioides bruguierae]|uniref:DUF1800 domain-containing protein n=1 Tax=Nocardioides bruguierae TaxID=2945102 RepID=A0A9X2IEJ8_9ACTN|nr:DUF1800 domain-containing protein [Nocardioides bruguierae]MCM0620123.1 DUF1800 domain-containing protein [Nocardioides bruguierae]
MPDYTPARWTSTPVLARRSRLVASRFSYGTNPALVAEVQAAGGGLRWFEQQVSAAATRSQDPDVLFDWWPDLNKDAATLWQRQVDDVRGVWEVMWDYGRRLMTRRVHSDLQVLEVMTELFEGHLHVTADGDAQATHRAPYGELIRSHALGRFDDMLAAAITHPAMLLYLDQATSTKSHPNENLARELLELHTVGVGAYTEDDVKNAARILTGWRVRMWTTFAPYYDTDQHWTGAVSVGDFTDANTDPDGRALTDRFLRHLAHRPETALRIARRLAVKFIGDDVGEGLVRRMAQTYLDNDTAIVPVLRVLLRSRAFRLSQDAKLRDPAEDVVATYRVLQARVQQPTSDDDAANAMIWQAQKVGLVPMAWPRPDGQPIHNSAWATASRAMASMEIHWVMAGGWWPSEGVEFLQPSDWAPTPLPVTFAQLVDHLARLLHGRPSNRNVLRAACEACSVDPDTTVTASSAVLTWKLNRLLAVLLDHPRHYSR